jgi:hypothetical protein
VPASHQFNRRIAAIGTALALVALPITGTIDAPPALGQPSPTETASAGQADTEAAGGSGGADSADATSAADGSNASGSDAEAEGNDSGITAEDGSSTASSKSEADTDGNNDDDNDTGGDGNEPDGACADTEGASDDGPCKIDEPLPADWGGDSKQTLRLPKPKNEPGSMPESWKGETFKLRKRSDVNLPVQSSSDTASADSAQSAERAGDTDDSGNPLPSAEAQADVPDELKLRADGYVVSPGNGKPVRFTGFAEDPEWKFDVSEGEVTVVSGRGYPDPGNGSSDDESDGSDNGNASSDDDKDGSANGSHTAGETAKSDSDSDSTTSANGNADGSRADSDSGSGSDSNSSSDSASAARGDTSDDSDTSSDSVASKDSGSNDRADSPADKDSDGSNSDSRAEGSRSSDSDSSASGSDSGEDEGSEDSEDDDDGSGSSLGTADADGSTPDPSTGNGSQDGRETIPGTTGDEWLPGDEDDSEHPDYSDPVPQNPDAPTPKDDTDLITGGDQPSPRADQNPSPSFGESIISTIVSSWPVFVLAASGMAAVGFIIYLMGRRGKQE